MTRPSSKSGIVAIGECMLELRGSLAGNSNTLQLAYGGDTLNTAVYLARQGVRAGFITLLGDDPRSDWLVAQWQAEGVVTEAVGRVRGRQPGLYWITTDAHGERSFSYWRREAPARELFDDPAHVARLQDWLGGWSVIYLSGVTLSLYEEASRERLFDMLAALRLQGVRLVFDGNYRPSGWLSPEAARRAFERTLGLTDIALPTFEDEALLFGDVSPAATATRLQGYGVAETAIKLGAEGVFLADGNDREVIPTQVISKPVDTTAAGDAFNAGYLAARSQRMSPIQAVRAGQRLASCVIQHSGAIIPRHCMPL